MNDKEWEKFGNFLARVPCFPRERVARELILGGELHENPPAEYGEILRELHRIGLNMNQIAIKANAYGFIDEPKLREAMADICEMKDTFRKSFR